MSAASKYGQTGWSSSKVIRIAAATATITARKRMAWFCIRSQRRRPICC